VAKAYLRGFMAGLGLGAAYLSYVYWRANLFPGKSEEKRFYAWVRGLDNP